MEWLSSSEEFMSSPLLDQETEHLEHAHLAAVEENRVLRVEVEQLTKTTHHLRTAIDELVRVVQTLAQNQKVDDRNINLLHAAYSRLHRDQENAKQCQETTNRVLQSHELRVHKLELKRRLDDSNNADLVLLRPTKLARIGEKKCGVEKIEKDEKKATVAAKNNQ